MKCVIIAGGDLNQTDEVRDLITASDLIVCADGGAGHLRALNILPHVLVGDLDSIQDEDRSFFAENKVKILSFPPRKNFTDSELCVSWAIDHHATDVTFLGVTGTRLDHTLANIFLLRRLVRENIPARIINQTNEIHMVTDQLRLAGRAGDLLSLVPVTRQVTGVTLEGLEYPLSNATLEMGSSLGISNVFRADTASVSVGDGILIVTKSRD
jgi:thiamine pyrophosphokinase